MYYAFQLILFSAYTPPQMNIVIPAFSLFLLPSIHAASRRWCRLFAAAYLPAFRHVSLRFIAITLRRAASAQILLPSTRSFGFSPIAFAAPFRQMHWYQRRHADIPCTLFAILPPSPPLPFRYDHSRRASTPPPPVFFFHFRCRRPAAVTVSSFRYFARLFRMPDFFWFFAIADFSMLFDIFRFRFFLRRFSCLRHRHALAARFHAITLRSLRYLPAHAAAQPLHFRFSLPSRRF